MLLPETLKLHNKEEFEFHYIYFLPWKNQMVESIEKAGGKVLCFSAENNIQIIARFRRVIKFIRDNDIQLIHCHLPWAGFLGRLIYSLTKIPTLYTEHNKQERYHRITFHLNKWSFNRQTSAIAVSSDVAQSIKSNITPRIDTHIILNGVNTSIFQRQKERGLKIRNEYNIPEGALVVGTVAVFRFQKRLEEWLEVFHKAKVNIPNLYGIIVGDGPLKDQIIAKKKELALDDVIVMPGLQTNTIDWFSAMDIFMITSVFEGLPIALLEAMSMKCAIVTTDAGGIKEVIKEGENGLMVDVDHWEKLSQQLTSISKDEELKASLGEKARSSVKSNFGMERMVKELETLYRNSIVS